MSKLISILIFLLAVTLSLNAVYAGKDYNSSISNTSSIMAEGGITEETITSVLTEIDALRDEGKLNPDNVAGVLQRFEVVQEIADRILQEYEELQGVEIETELAQEKISIADLGVGDPGLLPTSPFYFLKEWGRGVRIFFTFNPVAKANLELRYTSEKAAEAKKVQEQRGSSEQAIQRALENYQKSQGRLRERLGRLKETSQNPNVDRLLNNLVSRMVRHEKLFDELLEKAEAAKHDTAMNSIRNIKARMADVMVEAAKKDNAEKFIERLRNVFNTAPGSRIKDVRHLEIMDRLRDKAPEELRPKLDELRVEFADKVKNRLEELSVQDPDKISGVWEKLPGDRARRLEIVAELKERLSDRAAQALGRVQEDLEERAVEREDIAELVKETIERAEKMVKEAESVTEIPEVEVPESVTRLLRNAKEHLRQAKEAFESKEYGRAFGLANSAVVEGRNAFHILKYGEFKPESSKPEPIAPPETVKPPEEKVVCIQVYDPVCGADDKTYPNACMARAAGVEIVHQGTCDVTRKDCSKEECAPAPGMPNYICPDGKTVAGPVCKRNTHGQCGWFVISCPPESKEIKPSAGET